MTRGVAFGAPSFNAGQAMMFPAIPWHRRSLHRLDGAAPSFFFGPRYGKHVVRGRSASLASVISTQNNSTIRTYFDKDGILRTAPANTTRITHRNGFAAALFEGPATNYIRNSVMSGAVVGTIGSGGVLPTNMSMSGAVGNDLVTSVVATGVENGAPYVDIRFVGQNTTTRFFGFESQTFIPAATGEVRTFSCFTRVVAGVVDNLASLEIVLSERNSSGSNATGGPANSIDLKPTASSSTRRAVTRMMTASDCVYLLPYLRIPAPSGPIDFTIRISLPQCEAGGLATSPILTNGTVLTRTGDLPVLHSSAADMTAWAFRGYVPSLIAGQALISASGGNYLRASTITAPNMFFDGTSGNALQVATNVFPGEVQFCGGWGPTTRRASNNGSVAVDSTQVTDRSRATMYIGPSTGLVAGQVIYLDELVAWALPDRPSAAGVQLQARAAA